MMFNIKHARKILLFITLGVLVLLTGCHDKQSGDVIKVGTIAGPETQLMQVAKEVAQKKYGASIQIVEFTDYVIPNEALADGSIDANVYQSMPYLQNAIQKKGYKIVSIGKTFIYPIGIYSKKINKLADLKENSIIAIPNDPSNEARALLLLQEARLIQLRSHTDIKSSLTDVIKNPKNLKIEELDAAQLPRALPDADLAVINTNYAMLANLLPSRDALFIERPDSPYANLIVVRAEDKNNPKFKVLIDSLHSKEVILKANKLFKGQAIRAWDITTVHTDNL